MAVWTGKRVSEYVETPPEIKINPNGVDIGVSEIWKINENSEVLIDGKLREIKPEKKKVEPVGNYYILEKGLYEVRIANKVKIPMDAIALLLPRSTFNRLGILKFETALWDSGYEGFGTQTVYVPVKTLKVHKNEKWFQMIFIDNKDKPDFSYNGHYQGEKPLD